eukprot:m.55139 g.55139  ORF g.55139 m.55139 type:complete len:490 (+) comp11467_c0_seq4:236-1705(+)
MRQRHECHGVHWIMWTCQRLVLIVTLAITLQPLSSVGKAPAVFFYSPHKTGSVLVYDILTIASSVMKLCHLRVQHNSRQGACGTYVRCFGRTMGESFSFHRQKDAAEFCPAWIEEQLTGLSRADYTQEPYLYYPVARRGFLYGPIRHSEPYTDIVSSLSKNPRVRPVVICHKRHPLDQLVSEYYSFGFTHPEPSDASEEKLRQFREHRQHIQSMSVDEYVLQQLANKVWWTVRYKVLLHYRESPSAYVGVEVIESMYEEMVMNFDTWLKRLITSITRNDISTGDEAYRRIYKSYSQSFHPDGHHRKSVFPGSHVAELKPQTISTAYEIHSAHFNALGYSNETTTHYLDLVSKMAGRQKKMQNAGSSLAQIKQKHLQNAQSQSQLLRSQPRLFPNRSQSQKSQQQAPKRISSPISIQQHLEHIKKMTQQDKLFEDSFMLGHPKAYRAGQGNDGKAEQSVAGALNGVEAEPIIARHVVRDDQHEIHIAMAG